MDNGTDNEEAQKQRVARKRIAIAAEALSSASDVKIPNIPKTEAVLRVLGAPAALHQAQTMNKHPSITAPEAGRCLPIPAGCDILC